MSTYGAYKRIDDGLVLHLDAANIKSFRGEPTTNLSQQNVLEKISTSEYLGYENIAYIFDMNGIGTYTFSFDLKTKTPGNINVYCNDTESQYIKYYFGRQYLTTTTQYQRFTFTSEVTVLTPSATSTRISFYGGYGSGIIPSVKNMQIEKKDHATPFTPTSRGTTVATGGGLIDLSGYDNHGELVNGVLYDSNNCGSLKFDGIDDYIKIPSIIKNLPFSMSFWVNLSLQSNHCFYSSRTVIGDGISIFALSNNIRFDTGVISEWVTNYVIPTNQWVYLTLLADGTYKKLFVNGILHSSIAYNATITNISNIIATIGLSQIENTSYGNPVNGKMSNISIYNRALSQSELTQLYNSTKTRYI